MLYYTRTDSTRINTLAKQKKVVRVAKGLYADITDTHEQVDELIIQNWMKVIENAVPKAVAAYKTALTLKLEGDGCLFIYQPGAKAARRFKVRGLDVRSYPMPGDDQVEQLLPAFFRTTYARTWLDNLAPARERSRVKKTASQAELNQAITSYLIRYGEDKLNQVRDEARQISVALAMGEAFKILNSMIAALLASGVDEREIADQTPMLNLGKTPFDEARIGLFGDLAGYLRNMKWVDRPYQYDKHAYRHLAFYESYFSNFIEGTEFEIDEAQEIVFNQRPDYKRPQDSHDILAVFELVKDVSYVMETPRTSDEFLQVLVEKHRFMMSAREDKRPGKFKERKNKAGNTAFVLPHLVQGTLLKGFEQYLTLPEGMARAIYLQFLVAEVHPFDDGNGRLSRLMLNSELMATEQEKVIVPVCKRDDYLNGLRKATRSEGFRSLVKVFDQLQAFTQAVDWRDLDDAREQLTDRWQATSLPDDGLFAFNQQLKPLELARVVDDRKLVFKAH